MVSAWVLVALAALVALSCGLVAPVGTNGGFSGRTKVGSSIVSAPGVTQRFFETGISHPLVMSAKIVSVPSDTKGHK